MDSDLERSLVDELDDVASHLVVPPLPDLDVTSPGRRRSPAVHLGRVDHLAPLLVAAAVIVLVALVTLGSSRQPGEPRASVPSPTRTTPTPTTDRPKLISYAGEGSGRAEVRTTADAAKLVGAPVSFQRFIGRAAERVNRGATCEVGFVGVAVTALRTDGYAVGAVNDCGGGHVALWAIVDGRWREVDATQDLWDCAVLAQYRVPSDIAGDTCYDDDTRVQRSYRQS